jgi:GAF domain-containing protein
VEPLPEALAAIDELTGYLREPHDLRGQLDAVGRVATGLVPSVVAVSLSIVVGDETFTVTATDPSAGLLDAAQYLEDGPCLLAIDTGQRVLVADVLDEETWRTLGVAAAQVGVRSSLSLPLRDDDGRITGGLNIYASEPHAFDARENVFAAVFDSPVSELVKNADLSFRSREWARELPDQLRSRKVVEQAVGALMAARDWSAEDARAKMQDAAERAGVEVEAVANIVLRLAA